MGNYTVTITNYSTNTETFILCYDNTDVINSRTNVFFSTPAMAPGASYDISFSPLIWAVCGQATPTYTTGASVRNSQPTPMLLSPFPGTPNNATVGVLDDTFQFLSENDPSVWSTLQSGQIGVKVSNYVGSLYPYTFVGVGKQVPQSTSITPVLTYTAKAGSKVIMQPLPVFFVAVSLAARGFIVGKTDFQFTADINFAANPNQPIANINLQDDGTFAPVVYTRKLQV